MKIIATCLFILSAVFPGAVYASNDFLDLRAHGDVDDYCYYVEFYSRVTFPPTGHAFVRWKVIDRKTNRQASDCFGFYPETRWRGILQPVTGALCNEGDAVKRYILTNSLIVQVDRTTFLDSRNAIPRWQNRIYFMFGQNCTYFTDDVAQSIGLNLPYCRRGFLPMIYLENLKSANTSSMRRSSIISTFP